MKIAIYTVIPSPHMFPFARELALRIGEENIRYIYEQEIGTCQRQLGWNVEIPRWTLNASDSEAREWLENADVLFSGLRDPALFARRARNARLTCYASERWFKPPVGALRLLMPSYFRTAWMLAWFARTSPFLFAFPIGVHARRDFARIGVPQSKMVLWGYGVMPSKYARCQNQARASKDCLNVLWTGRMLPWKRADTLVRAVHDAQRYIQIQLTLVGEGPKHESLVRLVQRLFGEGSNAVRILPPMPIERVRDLMRSHDVYVLPSNAYEGWGAVVSEALEEGMTVVGTFEAGSSATLLDDDHLFHAGDWRRLSTILQRMAIRSAGERLPKIGEWSSKAMAERFLSFCAKHVSMFQKERSE